MAVVIPATGGRSESLRKKGKSHACQGRMRVKVNLETGRHTPPPPFSVHFFSSVGQKVDQFLCLNSMLGAVLIFVAVCGLSRCGSLRHVSC